MRKQTMRLPKHNLKTEHLASTIAAYVCVFALPVLSQLTAYYVLKTYPFGDNSILNWDLRITYTYYYEWFRNVLLGDGNVMYSFSKSLGGNMFAAFSTACASPINLLLVFFPACNPVPFVTFSITVKYGLAGISCLFFLRNRFSIRNAYAACLAIGYATMTFMTSQSMNPMWMDAVVMLPIVMVGLFRLLRQKKVALFYFSLLATIFINWYNGYQICLFCIFYYICESIIYAPEAISENRRVRLAFLVEPGRFSIVFTLAILSSFVLLLPTAAGLLRGKGAPESTLLVPGTRFFFPNFIRGMILGQYQREVIPQLYAGSISLLCAIAFLLNPSIQRREKAALMTLLVFLLVSMWFAPTDRIWCGFRDGQSFYCRYSYLFSFVVVFAAARDLSSQPAGKIKRYFISAAVVIAVCIVATTLHLYPSIKFPLLEIAIVLTTAGLLIVNLKSVNLPSAASVSLSLILIAIATLDASASSYQVIKTRIPDVEISGEARYQEYFGSGLLQFEELDASDGTDANAYRIQKLHYYLSPFPDRVGNDIYVSSNEGLVYGYSQVSQYDSAYDDAVQNFICNLGYCPESLCWTTFNYPEIASDSLLGIRYVSSKEKPLGYVDPGLMREQDSNKFYENPYALPLGFGADWSIINDLVIPEPDGALSKNPFDYQNQLFSALGGDTGDIFAPLDYEHIGGDAASESWTVSVPANSVAYGYIAAPHIHVDVIVDGKNTGLNFAGWKFGIFPVANETDEDREIEVSLRVNPAYGHDPGFSVLETPKQPYFYRLEMDRFETIRDKLASRPFVIDQFDDGYVRGTYDCITDDELLFTTIPYDAGWSINVNGKPVDARIAQNTFIAIPMEKGQNNIEMRYISPGLLPGLIVSSVSLLLFSLYAWTSWRRKQSSYS